MARQTNRSRASVTGVGRTEFSRSSGRSILDLALEASCAAVADAGLEYSDIDSIVTYGLNDSVPATAVATGLGLPELSYYADFWGGGNICVSTLGTAAMAVSTGVAKNVLIYRAMNGRSGKRLGGTGMDHAFSATGEAQFTHPIGWQSYPQYIAMLARRHMIKYGTTSEDFGQVAVSTRKHAVLNERAQLRQPMTIEDHQTSRIIADPLRLFDICLESDGACAMVVSPSDRARDLRQAPVDILGWALGGGPRPGYGFDGFFAWEELADLYGQYIAPRVWSMAGVGPADVDVASIYDCFSFSVIAQLEGFGFAPPGEGSAFVADGRIELGGELPINTNGGMLSEAYIHGLNGTVEMVDQLRGHCGARQVEGAEIAFATGFGVTTGCAVVLGK